MMNTIKIQEILIILGVSSWLLGKIADWRFKQPKKPEIVQKHFVILPKWANMLCARSSEMSINLWSAQFQLGGIVLIVLWLNLFVNGKDLGFGELFLLSFITYFLIPGWLIRDWQKTN